MSSLQKGGGGCEMMMVGEGTVHSLGCKMAISKNPKGTGDHTYGLLCISNNDNV